MKHGKGIEKLKNGDIYDGNYCNGFFHGYGEYFWLNGSVYKGQFIRRAQAFGLAKMRRANMKAIFELTKKKGMEFSVGSQVVFTKAIFRET